MRLSRIRRLAALAASAVLLLSACSSEQEVSGVRPNSDALTWTAWSGYDDFLALAARTYPDIELEFTAYAGANRTGYSWAQMRGDDIPDIFITSQILDEELAKERLVDLSSYDFVSHFSTAQLDQVAIDGGVYLLPVSNAMYGIFYNKTLMEEHGWEVPTTFAELEALCSQIEEAGLIPGVIGTELTGTTFSAVLNLAKTGWLTTPEGMSWEQDFLDGQATAAGRWEGTMDYIQQYIDIGMFHTDPEDRHSAVMLQDYLGGGQAVFCTAVLTVDTTELSDSGDELGMMPFISRNGRKNLYMYSTNSYIGISSRLAEPGNEQKLEDALKLLSLLFSQEGQSVFVTEQTPCMLSVLDSQAVPEDALIYDAQQALWDGRAFPMTYAGWENVLSDMGQAYKEWFRGENGMDGPRCIARMDELQSGYLNSRAEVYFCESTAPFTVEQTARLVGQALGSGVDADAAIIPYATLYREEEVLSAGITGRLYRDQISTDVAYSIAPGLDGEYAVLTMTGAQARELAAAGFDPAGDGDPYPYVLVTKGGGELKDDQTCRVAFLMGSYTEEAGEAYHAQVTAGYVRDILRDWLTEQKTVSPDEVRWK